MFIHFLLHLKKAGIPVGVRELLHLHEAMAKGVIAHSVEDFYHLCRALLVKRDQDLDKFDLCFSELFGTLQELPFDPLKWILADWLKKNREFPGEAAQAPELAEKGDLALLQKQFEALLQEQQNRHEGGSTWIGTAGKSPFGAWGKPQQGYRLGQQESRHRKALKVWEQRDFKELDESTQLDSRQFQSALRRLRQLSRSGSKEQLDLEATIKQTCHQGGLLQEVYRPLRSNGIRLLLLLDIGGSMDEHVKLCEQLFSAARHEFQHLEYYYFHNCLYEKLWKTPSRRRHEFISTQSLFHTYQAHYRVIVVGDASMSPYELHYKGGSVEHANEEPGLLWLQRLRQNFPHTVWLNPLAEKDWGFTESIEDIKQAFEGCMFPLSLKGLQQAVNLLKG